MNPRTFGLQRGFTLIELLVVMAVIGILAGLLFPAVQSLRETARRTECLNNLRQQGTAVTSYYNSYKEFPNSVKIFYGHGWSMYMQKYMEGDNLYSTLLLTDQTTVYDNYWDNNDANEAACSVFQPVLKCPSDVAPDNWSTGFSSGIADRAISSYLPVSSGNCPDYRDLRFDRRFVTKQQCETLRSGIMAPTSKADPTRWYDDQDLLTVVRINDVSDGISHTLMIGETIFDQGAMAGTTSLYGSDHWVIGSPQIDTNANDLSEFCGSTFAPLNYYHSLTDAQILAMTVGQRDNAARQISAGFASWHSGDGVNFVLGDGSTRFISADISDTLKMQLGMRNDGQIIAEEF